MNIHVEKAQFKTYIGLNIEWILHLVQIGDQLSGTGEKVSVNSSKINFKDRTTLKFNGNLIDNKFTINFIESGSLRETSGLFKGSFTSTSFLGTFSSTASESEGKITGLKMF